MSLRVPPLTLPALLLSVLQLVAAEPAWLARAWQSDDGLPNNDVTCLAQAPDGAMLFATRGGLGSFDGWRFRDIAVNAPGHTGTGVNAVLPARDGTRWLVARAVIVRQKAGEPDRVIEMPALNLGGSRETAFFENPRGVAWLCYEGGRFHRIENGRAEQVPVAPDLSPTFASCAALDAKGDVWAAGPQVLARWREGRFEKVATLPKDRCVLGRAAAGGMWIGAGRKLLRCTEGGGVSEAGDITAAPPGTRIATMIEDSRGRVWLGTFGGGLWLRTGDAFQSIALPNPDVGWLCEDREGNVWAATAGGGACRVRPRVLTLFDEPGGPRGEIVRALCTDTRGPAQVLAQDAAGRVWAGTAGGFLLREENGQFVREAADELGPACSGVRALLVAPDGALLIGTQGAGIARLTGGRCRTITRDQGPPHNVISQLALDAQGRLWAGSDADGVVPFPRRRHRACRGGISRALRRGTPRATSGRGAAARNGNRTRAHTHRARHARPPRREPHAHRCSATSRNRTNTVPTCANSPRPHTKR